jgi:RNA ligase (TIGR02306 family)
MSNSTHEVTIVPIVLERHPNADSLSICNVFGGYTCVLRTEDWQGVKYGAYLPPDSVVDTTRPEFSFLVPKAKADGTHRVKAMKLRGVVSFGLMVPAPEGSKLSQDVAKELGVTHYEPPLPGESKGQGLITGGETAKAPNLNSPKYDLDSFRKYYYLLEPGEKVWVTEKIHGCSARYVYDGENMHCGSKNEWKKEYPDYTHITMDWLRERVINKETGVVDEERCVQIYDKLHNQSKTQNLWWKALSQNPEVEKWCRDNPNKILYGEVYGQVQNLKYGQQGLAIAIFDVMSEGRWLNAEEARDAAPNVPWVPFIGIYDYDFAVVVAASDGKSLIADHYREGCVVKPLIERRDLHLGRVCLKCVGATYLEKDK